MAASHYAFMSSDRDEPNLQICLGEAAGCFIIDFIPIEYTLFEHLWNEKITMIVNSCGGKEVGGVGARQSPGYQE